MREGLRGSSLPVRVPSPQPPLLHDLRKPALLRADDRRRAFRGALDGAAGVLNLGVTGYAGVVSRVRVTGERRSADLVAVAGRLDVVANDDDAVELETAGHVQVAVHEQDALSLRV